MSDPAKSLPAGIHSRSARRGCARAHRAWRSACWPVVRRAVEWRSRKARSRADCSRSFMTACWPMTAPIRGIQIGIGFVEIRLEIEIAGEFVQALGDRLLLGAESQQDGERKRITQIGDATEGEDRHVLQDLPAGPGRVFQGAIASMINTAMLTGNDSLPYAVSMAAPKLIARIDNSLQDIRRVGQEHEQRRDRRQDQCGNQLLPLQVRRAGHVGDAHCQCAGRRCDGSRQIEDARRSPAATPRTPQATPSPL